MKDIYKKIMALAFGLSLYALAVVPVSAVVLPPTCDPDVDPTCVPDCTKRYEVLVAKGVPGVTKLVGELKTPDGLEKCVPNDNFAGGV